MKTLEQGCQKVQALIDCEKVKVVVGHDQFKEDQP
jgi:hypothetical protein